MSDCRHRTNRLDRPSRLAERSLERDVVPLDLSTPGMAGREIRADETLVALPVVVLSASSSPRDVDARYRAGASAYRVNPTRYSEHRELLVAIFRYRVGCVVIPEGNAVV